MEADRTEALREAVIAALAARRSLRIAGAGTKDFLTLPDFAAAGVCDRLDVAGHAGILHYDPAELVLTARAGTPLAAIEATLAGAGQMLAFEPPHFGSGATLGGTVASGLSGPRRPFAGSVRDHVLGCRLINGRGEVLSFGGQVMKNVAGFDIARLMAGARGALGVLLEVSLRVVPRPACERTLVLPMDAGLAITSMNRWSGQPWPISALAHLDGWTYVRLAGHASALKATQAALGGDWVVGDAPFWQALREQSSRFFRYPPMGQRLWRLSLAPATPVPALAGHWLYDWGGALRWLRSDAPPAVIHAAAGQAGGHARLFRGDPVAVPAHAGLPSALLDLHRRVKSAFDPQGVFNPGLVVAA